MVLSRVKAQLLLALWMIWAPSLLNGFMVQPKRFRPRHIVDSATTGTSSVSGSGLPESLLKTITKEGNGPMVRLGDIATVKYACYVSGNPSPFSRSTSKAQKMMIGEGAMIPGFEQAIRSMRVGERCMVQITDATLGYGSTGVPSIVPADALLDLDIEVLEAQPATANIDFDRLAEADNTPRTASDIAAAFAFRNQQKALNPEPELEGLDWFIAKAKSFYFYGLFEGETGERAPWFLRPSITFPLAFLVVGAAFYVSYVGGAISERGAQSTDELDEIILSSTAMFNVIAIAFAESPINL
jgi:FKBP-type peptidyl-prolyl cis-trans isomerase